MAPRYELGPAVQAGRLRYTSPSAMQKAERCLRQWRYRYVDGLPDKPPGRGARLGIAGHARWEHYLLHGKDVLGPLERPAFSRGYAPAPHPAGVEMPLDYLRAREVPVVGYIDVYDTRGDAAPLVLDWKYRRTLGQYTPSPEDLAAPTDTGIQMLAYGVEAIARTGTADGVRLTQVHMPYEGAPDAERVSVDVSTRDCIERWEQVSDTLIPLMQAAAQAADARDVQQNLAACRGYGGCPYVGVCLNSASNLFRALMPGPTKE